MPESELRTVLLLILEKRVELSNATLKKTTRRIAAGDDSVLDEMGIEDNTSHAAKVGKWASDAARGVRCPMFFLCVAISSRVKAPLDHCLYALMQRRNYGEPQNLAEFVWGKASTIRAEIVKLTTPDAWRDILEKVPPADRPTVWSCITRVALRVLAEYDARIMGRVTTYPAKLLLLVKSPHDTDCTMRWLNNGVRGPLAPPPHISIDLGPRSPSVFCGPQYKLC